MESRGTLYKPGFTWRAALAILFASVTILPVNLYLSLVAGATIAAAASYITLILFTEVALLMGSSISKQEAFIIFTMSSVVAASPVYINFVYRSFFVESPITRIFKDPYTGKPLPEVIPSFWAPPPSSPAHTVRSFLHPDWIAPQLISHFQYGILFIIQEIALTIICSMLYNEVERLPFPLADVTSQLITTIVERPRERMGMFLAATLASGFYSFLAYGVPTLTYGLFGVQMQLVPVPWIDLTTGYLGVEKVLPGAILGISTDPMTFVAGFILPLRTLTYMLIGSVTVWILGNWMALTVFRDFFPEWANEWSRGMSIPLVLQRSMLRVWLAPHIGVTVGLALATLASSSSSIIKSLKTLARVKEVGSYSSLPTLLAMYLGATFLSVLIFHYLVPDFPVWLAAALSIGFSFLNALVATRVRGETTITISIPYVWWGAILLSGYPKVDAFFFSPVIGGSLAPSWVESLRVAELTETKQTDFFKAFVYAFALYTVFSFIFVSFFWMMAPIPSSVYPWTIIQWPIQAMIEGMWYTRQITVRADLILGFAALAFALGVLQKALRAIGIPFDAIALLTGTQVIPTSTITMLLGGVVGHYLLRRAMGKERWEYYRLTIAAGVATGMGLVVGVLSAFALIFKTAWIKPY
ncbi:MAG: OPT/YSL family transporter [Thermofilaceae archaeon]